MAYSTSCLEGHFHEASTVLEPLHSIVSCSDLLPTDSFGVTDGTHVLFVLEAALIVITHLQMARALWYTANSNGAHSEVLADAS